MAYPGFAEHLIVGSFYLVNRVSRTPSQKDRKLSWS